MALDPSGKKQRAKRRGQTLVFVALGLVMIIAIAGLAIDLASLYVTRSEAQRAADAAALAGAKAILDSGYLARAVGSSTAQTLARQRATLIGNQNSVGEIIPVDGQSTEIVHPDDVSFDFGQPLDPRITVLVQRTTARSNAVPTFFMKIFGVHTADVSAAATAEVYFGVRCVKPWMIPDCDASHIALAVNGQPTGPDASKANKNCPQVDATGEPVLDADGNYAAFYQYYVYPKSLCNPTLQDCIVYPGPASADGSSGGLDGRLITVKPSQPSASPAPGEFYAIYLEPTFTPGSCPDCPKSPGGGGGGGMPSGDTYRDNISCCNQKDFSLSETVTPILGNMAGPTALGVDCLIHEGKNGTGQDVLDTSTILYQYRAGSSNPSSAAQAPPSRRAM